MHKLTYEEVQMWDRRRRNMRIMIAALDTTATQVARSVSLSENTLTKFLNGSTPTMSPKSVDKVLPYFGLTSINQLDTDDPLNDPAIRLQKVIDQLDPEIQRQLIQELEVRFLNKK